MKQIRLYTLLWAVFSLILSSCGGSSTKRLSRGSYESAINKAVRVLQKNPNDQRELETLKTALNQSTTESLAVIERLTGQGNSEALVGILDEYISLQRQKDRISALPSSITSQLDVKDYTVDIQEARDNASQALFAEVEPLMRSPNKDDHRAALDRLHVLKRVDPQFPDINRWITDAEELAVMAIWVNINDQSGIRFRDTLQRFLQKEKMADLNRDRYLRYALTDPRPADGEVKVTIHSISVEKSTGTSKTNVYEKEIRTPKYVMDANGNVKKDANGNDMKTEEVSTIRAEVTEEGIDYKVVLRGTISYLDHYRNTEIDSEDLLSSKTITRKSFRISGNEDAIDASKKAEIEKASKEGVPNEKQLIKDQMKAFKEYVYRKIEQSKRMYLD